MLYPFSWFRCWLYFTGAQSMLLNHHSFCIYLPSPEGDPKFFHCGDSQPPWYRSPVYCDQWWGLSLVIFNYNKTLKLSSALWLFFLCRVKVICNNGSPVCISIHYLNGEEPDRASKQGLHKTWVCVSCVYTAMWCLCRKNPTFCSGRWEFNDLGDCLS